MSKDSTTVILATPLAYPKASKALSDVVHSLPAEKMPDFYDTLRKTYKTHGAMATIANLPQPLQSAVISNYPND